MDECISNFLKQDRVVATATTQFLKYVGRGTMQDGLRVVYHYGERNGIIEGTVATIIVIGGGKIIGNLLSIGVNMVKEHQQDKKMIRHAILQVQTDSEMNVDESKVGEL